MTLDQLEPILKSLSDQGFSLPQMRTLLVLRNGKQNMSSVAKLIGHSTAWATGSIDILEKKHLVERNYGTDDRRQILVQLTPQGNAALDVVKMLIKHSVN